MHRHLSTGNALLAALMKTDRQTAPESPDPLQDVLRMLAAADDPAPPEPGRGSRPCTPIAGE